MEFAAALPFLALVFAMAVDLSSVFYYSTALASAAREGARYGADHPSDTSGIVSRVVGEPSGSITLDPSRVAVTNDGTTVRVTVTLMTNPLTPVVRSVWDGRVSGTAAMPIMGQ